MAPIFIHRNDENVPCRRWSWHNQLLTVLSGTSDARGMKQWNNVRRKVKRGSKAIWILAPCLKTITEKDDNGQDRKRNILYGFKGTPVFAVEDTEGKTLPGAAKDKKSPVRVGHLIHLSDVLPKNLQGIRDKAIFLIGYAGAFRRSELVNLNVEDVHFESEGVRITVRHSKTDQESIGHSKDINYAVHSVNCPVKALKKWVEMGAVESGPLFRPVNRHGQILPQRLTPQSIALVVKRVMQALRMDPDQFSGHSLRAGFVTDAIKHGIQSQVIRRVTGHRSESTLSEYFREADTFDYNIIAKLGL